jgi:uncharacterized protein YebE (UPF0316 family)
MDEAGDIPGSMTPPDDIRTAAMRRVVPAPGVLGHTPRRAVGSRALSGKLGRNGIPGVAKLEKEVYKAHGIILFRNLRQRFHGTRRTGGRKRKKKGRPMFSEANIFLAGGAVFLARICDVSLGTVRTIVTVQGRTVLAFCLAVLEILIWITVVGAVISQIHDRPGLAVFYALGYATGNVIGILVERKLAFGLIICKVITSKTGTGLPEALRQKGQPVTVFRGEGMKGPVSELYMACRRRDLKWILPMVRSMDPEGFYIIEQVREMKKGTLPAYPSFRWLGMHHRK